MKVDVHSGSHSAQGRRVHAHGGAGRRQRGAWPALLPALVAAWLVAACGGGGDASPPVTPPAEAPRESALSASRPGELMSYVRAKLADPERRVALGTTLPGTIDGGLGAITGMAFVTAGATTLERSGTTVQEQGVDEDDLLKTDGSLLLALTRRETLQRNSAAADLRLWRRRADGGVDAAGVLPTLIDADAWTNARGMLMATNAQRVLTLGEGMQGDVLRACPPPAEVCTTAVTLPFVPMTWKAFVHLDLIGLANPATPQLQERVRIDGRLIGARQIGNMVYLVTQYTPALAPDALPFDAPRADREALISRLTVGDVLPNIRIGNGTPVPLVAETDCFVQPKNASPGISVTTMTAIDLTRGMASRSSRCFAGGSEALYMSPNSLYLATTRWPMPTGAAPFPINSVTDIHKFSLGGAGGAVIDYRGSGEVEGHLGWDTQRRSLRMSEFNGDLRVLTYTGQTGWFFAPDAVPTQPPPASPATLTILRERASDRSLQVLGKLPNAQRPAAIGKPNEQVYGVRFVGNRGYVVTFRRTDPLYVLDLSNPADPRVAGELEVPGFSDYLFPITDALLLGVGKDADARGFATGVKVALYDVGNPAQPRELASHSFGHGGSMSGLDLSRQGINLFARSPGSRVALPLALTDSRRQYVTRGLQKLEVDVAARSLRVKELINVPSTLQPWDLQGDRSVQIGDHVYYLQGASLTAHAW